MNATRSPADEADSSEVVLAEDDVDLRETYRIWLADHWDVHAAGNGRDALDAVNADTAGLLLDRQMPILSGPEVLGELEETSFDGFVVVVSAYEPDQYLDIDDVDDYLVKPISRSELVDALDPHVK